LTFKEDVPDLRNSKVTDIVNELLSFDVNLQLHDPVADYETAKSLFNSDVKSFEEIKPANAIILAVAHQEYQKLGWSDIAALIDGEGVVFDVKGMLPRENVPENITLLRL
jgi:UDP-N-acetyl-D-galactosamine dehydrogenase